MTALAGLLRSARRTGGTPPVAVRRALPGAPAPAGTHPFGPAARRPAGTAAAGAPSPRTRQAAPAMPSKTDEGRITNETQERTA